MGVYIRPFPGLKLRFTKRGVRAGVGPRWLRAWFGAGGSGISTGAGPVSYYRRLTPATASEPRKLAWHGQLGTAWTCPHAHRTQEAARKCAVAEFNRRKRSR